MSNRWTRKPPKAPEEEPSGWCWCWIDNENEPMVMELWPKRRRWPEGWWWTGPLCPRVDLPDKPK